MLASLLTLKLSALLAEAVEGFYHYVTMAPKQNAAAKACHRILQKYELSIAKKNEANIKLSFNPFIPRYFCLLFHYLRIIVFNSTDME